MGFRKDYFPEHEQTPNPLRAITSRRVRFEEVDALGMVWHGRYPSYLEDGRIAFGDTFGLSYLRFREERTMAPIVQMHLDYRFPLRFDETFQIETFLHWADAAKLNFSYLISNNNGSIVASGYTVQLLTEVDGTIMLTVPAWLEAFRLSWLERSGGAG